MEGAFEATSILNFNHVLTMKSHYEYYKIFVDRVKSGLPAGEILIPTANEIVFNINKQ